VALKRDFFLFGKMDLSSQKRSLSESSTGSEEAEDLSHSGFKKPRPSFSYSSNQPPLYTRRESQASTASSTSVSISEDDEADVQQLNQVWPQK
jgi:hypothetical protein